MKKIVCLLLATTLFVGCANEEASAPCNEMRVSVSVNEASQGLTRAGGFVNLDALKLTNFELFVLGTGYATTAPKYPVSFTSGSSTWATTGTVNLSGNEATVYAYYPSELNPDTSGSDQFKAKLSGTAGALSILATGQDMDGTDQTDFLYMNSTDRNNTKVSNASAAKATATIKLQHAMAKLSFRFNLDATYPTTATGATDAPVVSSVILKGKTAAPARTFNVADGNSTFNVATGAFETMKTSSSLTLDDVATARVNVSGETNFKNAVTVLVVPQTDNILLNDYTITAKIDNKTYTDVGLPAVVVSSSPSKWEAGKEYVYTITVSGTGMTVNSTVTVADWTSNAIAGTTTFK